MCKERIQPNNDIHLRVESKQRFYATYGNAIFAGLARLAGLAGLACWRLEWGLLDWLSWLV